MLKRYLVLSCCAVALTACNEPPSADEHQSHVQAQQNAEADREVGMPALKNWAEKRMVRDLYELRDKQVPTWAYVQSLDGHLICLGRSVGYGIPYAVQYSSPQKYSWVRAVDANTDGGGTGSWNAQTMPQAEPNGLFMPDNAEGTWLQMLAPDGTVKPVYVEPRVTVSQFRLSPPVVSQDCPADAKPGSK